MCSPDMVTAVHNDHHNFDQHGDHHHYHLHHHHHSALTEMCHGEVRWIWWLKIGIQWDINGKYWDIIKLVGLDSSNVRLIVGFEWDHLLQKKGDVAEWSSHVVLKNPGDRSLPTWVISFGLTLNHVRSTMNTQLPTSWWGCCKNKFSAACNFW